MPVAQRYRACEADTLGLGYRPGFTYYNPWSEYFIVLGYTKSGSVIVRDVKTGLEKTHLTSKDRFPGDTRCRLVAEVPNIFGWTLATTRSQREKVTVTS